MALFNIEHTVVDKTWTLFLDRDGVVNDEIVGSYVTSWEEFHFCEGALDALLQVSELFGRIVVVSNQRGVGRGIMSMDALKEVTQNMKAAVAAHGGRLDQAYACIAVEDTDHNRKPNTGMAQQAREDFPEIDFKKSIMVGNALSDMEFGKRLAMHTVFLTSKHAPFTLPHDLIDEQFPTLFAWAKTLRPATEMVG